MKKWRPDRLKAIREKMQLSLMKFAALVGVDKATVCNWEGGKEPTAANLVALCDATGKGQGYFYTGGGK